MSPQASLRLIARILWVLPAFLLLVSANQFKTALDVQRTLREGTPAVAEILSVEERNRSEFTYEYLHLKVTLPDGRVLEQPRYTLPHSFVPFVQNKDQVSVVVLPGSGEEIVIQQLGRPQWRLALINGIMSTVGLLLLSVGIYAWNRYLRKKGDPAYR